MTIKKAAYGLLATLVCAALCLTIFLALLLAWSLVAAPFVTLPSASPVIVVCFLVSSVLTVLLFHGWYRSRPVRTPK